MTTPITITVNVDTDSQLLADRVAAQFAEKVDAMEITLGGVTSVTSHTVQSSRAGRPIPAPVLEINPLEEGAKSAKASKKK